MPKSQNGWPVLAGDSKSLYTWYIPVGDGRFVKIRLRNGSAGFLLAHFALWFHEVIEPLMDPGCWGYAVRLVRGSETSISNHASGTAEDLNAPKHPLAKRGTYSRTQVLKIRARLLVYRRAIAWGGDYKHRADEMHFEIVRDLPAVARIAKRLMNTDRGRRILKANPSQRAVILK